MHDNKAVERGDSFKRVHRSCGLLFEEVERSELPVVVREYLLRQVAELFDAVEVFARLNNEEVHDG